MWSLVLLKSNQKFQFGCDNNSSKFMFQGESVEAIPLDFYVDKAVQ